MLQMKVKQVRWLFLGWLAAFFIFAEVSGLSAIGMSQEWSGDRYRIAGGTAPWALAFALVFIGLYAVFLAHPPVGLGQSLPGVARRFVAFWLDFTLAMAALAPILGLLPTFTEWRRTGAFAWNFVRTAPTPGDNLLAMILTLLVCFVLPLYYTLPLMTSRPSPGTCILGYQVIPDEGRRLSLPKALLRTILGLIAVSTAYLAPFVARDRAKGKIWLDKVFRTRAVVLG